VSIKAPVQARLGGCVSVLRKKETSLRLTLVFAASSVVFFGAGVYHLYALIDSSSDLKLAAFHAAFTSIDIVTAFLLLLRPDWFTYAFAALTLQQIYSHGMEALNAWRATATTDYVSLCIIVLMPGLFILLVYDTAMRKRRTS
jgi:hypothetical protein